MTVNSSGGVRIHELTNCDTIDTDANGNLICGADDTGTAGLWTDMGTYIRPNNYTSLAITDAGSLGIGTTSPTYKLDVVGNIGLNQYLYHNDDTNTYLNFESDRLRAYIGGEYLLDLYEGTQDHVKLGDGGSNINIDLNDKLFVKGSNGYVGIGIEAPAQKLHVVGNARFTGVPNCTGGSTLDTNSSGDLVCGTDDTGASYTGGEGINIVGTTISIKAPSATKGGIKSTACPSGQWVTGYNTTGGPVCSEITAAPDTYQITCAGIWDGGSLMSHDCYLRCHSSIYAIQFVSATTTIALDWNYSTAYNLSTEKENGGYTITAKCIKEQPAPHSYQITCRGKWDGGSLQKHRCNLRCRSAYSISWVGSSPSGASYSYTSSSSISTEKVGDYTATANCTK